MGKHRNLLENNYGFCLYHKVSRLQASFDRSGINHKSYTCILYACKFSHFVGFMFATSVREFMSCDIGIQTNVVAQHSSFSGTESTTPKCP